MRKALTIGIDHYEQISRLHGCVNDAECMKKVLSRHENGDLNMDVGLMTARGASDVLYRSEIRDAIENLFEGTGEIALLYFAGHGYLDSVGGYLCTSETSAGHDGVSLNEIMGFVNASKITHRLVILDSCQSGVAGSSNRSAAYSEIDTGVTIMTASTETQYATEQNGAGLFTSLFVDAMSGRAANLLGEITPGGVYAHIDKSLGNHGQRPVFKTNVTSFISLRRVAPPIPLQTLLRLPKLFPTPDFQFGLDPSFEPERSPGSSSSVPPPDPISTEIFGVLQSLNRVGLLVPVDAPHMWHAAMGRKACRLTNLGQHYHRLVATERI